MNLSNGLQGYALPGQGIMDGLVSKGAFVTMVGKTVPNLVMIKVNPALQKRLVYQYFYASEEVDRFDFVLNFKSRGRVVGSFVQAWRNTGDGPMDTDKLCLGGFSWVNNSDNAIYDTTLPGKNTIRLMSGVYVDPNPPLNPPKTVTLNPFEFNGECDEISVDIISNDRLFGFANLYFFLGCFSQN